MITLDFKTMDKKAIHKVLIGSIIPRPIALVLSKTNEDVWNVAPFSHFSLVSSDPAVIGIGINRKEGSAKDTARNILQEKKCIVHIVSRDILEDANQTAASLSPLQSELNRTRFTLRQSAFLDIPSIKEAKIALECEFLMHTVIEDDNEAKVDFFLAKIIGMTLDDSVYQDGKINYQALDPIARLAGHEYATLGEIISLVRPE